MSARRAAVVVALALLGWAAAAWATETHGSPLALAIMAGTESPRLFLAQRAIERTWGPSEDSVYAEVKVADWKSEGAAVAASAAIPGAGQLYVGENSGYLYLLAEATGWVSHTLFKRGADDRRDDAVKFAGSPTDPASAWSAERWASATGGDPQEILALYAADRSAYLRTLAGDDRYLAGWAGESQATRGSFNDLRSDEQKLMRRARYATWGLVLNHTISAVDALRAARIHDLPLRRNLDLRLQSGWRRGGPTMMAVLVRSF